jgi:hypothetical protein
MTSDSSGQFNVSDSDFLSKLSATSLPLTTSPPDLAVPDFSWQNPFPAVTLGSSSSSSFDSTVGTNPISGYDDFLNAPTDLSFVSRSRFCLGRAKWVQPNFFDYTTDKAGFEEIMNSLFH